MRRDDEKEDEDEDNDDDGYGTFIDTFASRMKTIASLLIVRVRVA